MKVLVTGSAGFIGSALIIKLLDRGDIVVGIDNHNNYYSPELKEARLSRHKNHPKYTHIRMNIEDREPMANLFKKQKFDCFFYRATLYARTQSLIPPKTAHSMISHESSRGPSKPVV